MKIGTNNGQRCMEVKPVPDAEETYIPISEVLCLFQGCCISCQAAITARISRHKRVAAQLPKKHLHPLFALIEEIATTHGLKVEDLRSRRVLPEFVEARRCFARQARELGYSYPHIGRVLGKHHTTILNLVKGKEWKA
jgi:hypothetical protein